MVGIYVVTELLSLNIFILKNFGDNLRVFTIQSFQPCSRFEMFYNQMLGKISFSEPSLKTVPKLLAH